MFEAMAFDPDPVAPLPWALLAICAVGMCLLAWRGASITPLTRPWLLLAEVGMVLAFGAKQGYVRHDAWHEPAFFLLCLALLVALLPSYTGNANGLAWGFGCQPCDPAGVNPLTVTEKPGMRSASESVRGLLNPPERASQLDAARKEAQQRVSTPEHLLQGLGASPTTVDPVEVTVAWAHGMDWAPNPVFQLYSAYTPKLDRLNVEDLLSRENKWILRDRVPWMAINSGIRPGTTWRCSATSALQVARVGGFS